LGYNNLKSQSNLDSFKLFRNNGKKKKTKIWNGKKSLFLSFPLHSQYNNSSKFWNINYYFSFSKLALGFEIIARIACNTSASEYLNFFLRTNAAVIEAQRSHARYWAAYMQKFVPLYNKKQLYKWTLHSLFPR